MRPVRTIAVTGHHRLPTDAAPRIIAAIHRIAGDTPGATWLTGGAPGTDQLAALALLARGERLELVLPCPPTFDRAGSSGRYRAALRHIIRCASSWVDLSSHDHPSAGRDRDLYLVDHADLLLVYWDGHPDSGPARAVRMADARHLPVIWVPSACVASGLGLTPAGATPQGAR